MPRVGSIAGLDVHAAVTGKGRSRLELLVSASLTLEVGKIVLDSPQGLISEYIEKLNAGQFANVVGMFEPTAVRDLGPDYVVHGREAIADALESNADPATQVSANPEHVHIAGDLALVIDKWTITASQPDGQPASSSGFGAIVLRRQSDGRWLVAIDFVLPDTLVESLESR